MKKIYIFTSREMKETLKSFFEGNELPGRAWLWF